MPCLKQPDAGLSALLYQRQRKSLLNQQAFEDLLGWLMGLEPTTTGITILLTVYLNMLIEIVTINTNQHVRQLLLTKNPCLLLIEFRLFL